MDFVTRDVPLSPATLDAASRCVVSAAADEHCVFLLNPAGIVVAVNSAGLRLLGQEADTVCGRLWAAGWPVGGADSGAREAAEAVTLALTGQVAQFSGTDGQARPWQAQLRPLEAEAGGTAPVLVLMRPDVAPEAAAEAEGAASLAGAMHDLANAITEMQGAARILRRGPAPHLLPDLAQQIAGIGERAAGALEVLRGSPALRR